MECQKIWRILLEIAKDRDNYIVSNYAGRGSHLPSRIVTLDFLAEKIEKDYTYSDFTDTVHAETNWQKIWNEGERNEMPALLMVYQGDDSNAEIKK